jgi:hypothetical protein
MKSGSLNLLEPSGPVKACNGIALLYFNDPYSGDKIEKNEMGRACGAYG